MSEFTIKKAEFVTSVVSETPLPTRLYAEIAMVGRSNVGKSSLINSVCNNKKLARTSSAPGKTRQINYFLINGEFYLVDLPGYGFAKAPKGEQKRWGELMEGYLSRTEAIDEKAEGSVCRRVSHIFLLLDIRHLPTEDDKQMFKWILYYGIPYTLVATKADKIARSKRQNAANSVAKALGAPPYAIPFSTENPESKNALLVRVGQIVSDFSMK